MPQWYGGSALNVGDHVKTYFFWTAAVPNFDGMGDDVQMISG
jgi:hypothetical protein